MGLFKGKNDVMSVKSGVFKLFFLGYFVFFYWFGIAVIKILWLSRFVRHIKCEPPFKCAGQFFLYTLIFIDRINAVYFSNLLVTLMRTNNMSRKSPIFDVDIKKKPIRIYDGLCQNMKFCNKNNCKCLQKKKQL